MVGYPPSHWACVLEGSGVSLSTESPEALALPCAPQLHLYILTTFQKPPGQNIKSSDLNNSNASSPRSGGYKSEDKAPGWFFSPEDQVEESGPNCSPGLGYGHLFASGPWPSLLVSAFEIHTHEILSQGGSGPTFMTSW